MSKTITIPIDTRKAVISLVLALVLVFGLSSNAQAQTPADDQYGSPTATASGNPTPFQNLAPSGDLLTPRNSPESSRTLPASSESGSRTSSGSESSAQSGDFPGSDDAFSGIPASKDSPADEGFAGEGPNLLAVGLGILAAIAGIYAAMYVASRVRPGLSLDLQRRALSFLVLAGLFFAAAQLLYALGQLLSSSGEPGEAPDTYLALGHFTAGTATAICLAAVGYLLRKSELDEVSPLRRSADLDPLTSLYNQPFFRRAASRRLEQAERHGIPMALAMIDVDNFKEYNDRFGHEAGNTVLRRVAGVLRRSVRADDLVARYGGEEFVMLLSSQPGEAEDALERIRSQIEARCAPDDDIGRQVTASIGVAAFTDEVRTLEGLIEAADEAMYSAKKAGKNRVIVSEKTA